MRIQKRKLPSGFAAAEIRYDIFSIPAVRAGYLFDTFLLPGILFFAGKDTGPAREETGEKNVQAEGAGSGSPKKDAARIFDTYGNSILRLAYSYLHGMEDAEDILQETLIRYMQKAPEFESGQHEKAWLMKVTANLSKNRIRSNKIRQADELTDMLADEADPDLSYVWDAVRILPDRYREIIHLFYQEGFRTAEIASILGMNESTVRSDLKRGRERLKIILKEAYDFE